VPAWTAATLAVQGYANAAALSETAAETAQGLAEDARDAAQALTDVTVTTGAIVGDDLVLTRTDATTINAGNVRGPQGIPGPVQSVDGQIGAVALAGTYATREAPTFGTQPVVPALAANVIDSTGWTLGAGWAGDLAAGFTHTAGTATLSRAMGATGTKFYLVQFSVASPTDSSAFTVTLGGSYGFEMYEGAYGGTWTYSRAIRSVADGPLVFTPETGFDGRIYGVTVREITAPAPASVTWTDSAGGTVVEMRTAVAALNNLFLGAGAGQHNLTGHRNVAVGQSALSQSGSGFYNTAIGFQALQKSTNGTRNVAIGNFALQDNIDWHRNIAIGSFSQYRTTSGHGNVSIGYDALWYNTTGDLNIAIGGTALGKNTTGSHNVALGLTAGSQITTGANNIAIGQEALYLETTGANNIAIGCNALRRTTTPSGNVAVGYWAASTAVTTTGLTVMGHNAGCSLTANSSTLVGYEAGYSATTGNQQTAMGFKAGYSIGTGNNNVAVGAFAMGNGAAGDQYEVTAVGTYAGRDLTTGGGRNTCFGAYAGATTTTGSNNLFLGRNTAGTAPTASNEMNVGNIIYGDMTGKRVRIGAATPTAALHLPAGTAATGTAPLKLTTGVNLTTPEAGAVEFDGTNLYFTTAAGVRKTVAVV